MRERVVRVARSRLPQGLLRRAAVELLVAAGHRDGIALIGQNDQVEQDVFRSATVARRVAGIRGAMADHGLDFEAEESIWLWEPQNGFDAVSRLLGERSDIRALVRMNDRLAFGAYQAIQERGLRVPDDISVVSFDNDELASYLRPGLTTVALPHEEMGRRAVDLLLSTDAAAEVLVPMPVIERASVSAPRD